MRLRTTIIACAAWLGCLSGSAAAADPVNPEAKLHAQDAYSAGLRYFDAAEATHDRKRYEDAYYEFAKAYAIYPDDKVLWALALCEVETQRSLEGLRHLREYDRREHVLEQPTHPKYHLLGEYLARAERATAHLAITAPAGALLRVDGADAGVAPLAAPVDVAPGTHAVTGELAGRSQALSIAAPAGDPVPVTIDLPAATPPVVPPAPPTALAPQPPLPPSKESPSASSARTATVVVMGGAGLVAAGIGVGFLVAAGSAGSTSQSEGATLACSQPPTTAACEQLANDLSTREHDNNIGRGLVIGGAALLAGAAAAWLLWPHPAEHPVAVVPSASRDGAGAWLVGRF